MFLDGCKALNAPATGTISGASLAASISGIGPQWRSPCEDPLANPTKIPEVLPDCHEWVTHSADKLVISGDALWHAMSSQWASQCLSAEEARTIVQPIEDALDKGTQDIRGPNANSVRDPQRRDEGKKADCSYSFFQRERAAFRAISDPREGLSIAALAGARFSPPACRLEDGASIRSRCPQSRQWQCRIPAWQAGRDRADVCSQSEYATAAAVSAP